MGRTILFVTDSHMGALNEGSRLLRSETNGAWTTADIHFVMPDIGNISREFMLELADGRKVLNPVLVREFNRPWSAAAPQILDRWTQTSPLAELDHEAIFLWGFAEMHWFACESDWANFGIDEERSAAQAPDRYLLPKLLIRETLAALVQPVLDVVLYLRRRGVRASTLAGPPPVPDNEYAEQKFPPMRHSSPATRLAIYELLLEIFAGHAAENGYCFHGPPKTVVDEFGFRRREFWNDAVHGDKTYGREILLSLKPFMEGRAVS
jgi:hypothetical protein